MPVARPRNGRTAAGPHERHDAGDDAGRENGMVSAEFAAALPALLLVFVAVLGGLRLGVDVLQVNDAARVAARAAARGENEQRVNELVARDAPGAVAHVDTSGTDVTVRVQAIKRSGMMSWLSLGWRPEASVTMPREASE